MGQRSGRLAALQSLNFILADVPALAAIKEDVDATRAAYAGANTTLTGKKDAHASLNDELDNKDVILSVAYVMCWAA